MNGSIRQRRDRQKTWQARYPGPGGKQRSKSFITKREAQAWLRSEISKIDRGMWIDPAGGKQLYGGYATNWLDSRVDIKPKTRHGYSGLLKSRVLPEFAGYQLQHIRPSDVRRWIKAMHDEGLSASRIRQAHQVLRASLSQATSDGLIGRNPAIGIDLPRGRTREMQFLTPAQINRLAELCDDRQSGAGVLVQFLAWSGLRWGEATALQRSSLNPLRNSVVVRESATEVAGRLEWGTTKNHESRTVMVAPPIFELLERHSAGFAKDKLVFTAPEGGPLRPGNFHNRVWKPAIERFSYDNPELGALRIHDLRHTAASLAISCGGNIMAVQRMLGHKQASITLDRYGHLYDDDVVRLAEAMERKYHAA